jgi:HK97 family phage prohead protease
LISMIIWDNGKTSSRLRVEVRRPVIQGYACRFDTRPNGLAFRIRKGAFVKTLQEATIRVLLNHDPNFVLGCNKSGTLLLHEDDKGLWAQIEPPDTQWADELLASMQCVDYYAAVNISAVKWNTERNQRTLTEVRLYGVSVITFGGK